MPRLIFILILLIASVWLGLKISADPGYALFSYSHWSVEMPLWFAVVSFLVFLFLFYTLLKFSDSIDFSLYRLKNWMRWRKKNKSYSKTNRGLLELIEARWRGAEYYLQEGIEQSDAPLINYLALAKAAHEQKAYDRRDRYLQKAHDASPQADIAIGLTQAQLQLNQGKLEQALATLKHLYQIAPRHALVLKLLERIYIRLGDWNALLALLPSLKKAKIVDAEQFNLLQKNTYQELLRAAGAKSLSTLQETWKKIPRKIQQEPTVIFSYAKFLANNPNTADEAEHVVFKCLKKTYDAELMRLYGLIVAQDTKLQLEHAESLLKNDGNNAILYLTLARLCMRCQLWGKARQYFEDSLKLESLPETYVEYGKLLEQLGEVNFALSNYREGLERIV